MGNRVITFGRFEAATILINALIIKVFLGLPQLLCEQVGSAAWMIALFSGLAFLVILLLILALYRRHEGKNIIEIAENLGGRPAKWLVGVLVLLPILLKGGIALRLAAETLNLITPYRLPGLLAASLVGIAMVVAAYQGVESVARLHALLVPVILLALLLALGASASALRLSNLFPIWGLGKDKVFSQSIGAISMYTDVIYVFLLYPYVKSEHSFRRSTFWGVAIAMVAQLAIVLFYVLTTQYPENGELFMPIYQISRIIKLGDNSQSIEAIFYPVWILSSLLYLSLSVIFSVEILGKVTKTKYQKLFILPVTALMFAIGYLPEGVLDAMHLSTALTPYLAVLCMLLPTLILLWAGIKKKGRGKYVA